MKKITKLVALLLALVFAFAMAACGKNNKGEESTTTTTAPQTTPLNLEILREQDEDMMNNYSLIAVNPNANWVDANGNPVDGVSINTTGADALINWILSDAGKTLITEYGKDTFGVALFALKDDAPFSTAAIPQATEETKTIRLSTTTSVNDSGLLDYMLPKFEETYGYKVEVTSAGTGKAIANAQQGNADLLLVHSKDKEQPFVDAGYARLVDGIGSPNGEASARLTFMYNYFVLVGPSSDPAGVKNAANTLDAFKAIADSKSKFISRGDGSGTHTKELKLWPAELGITEEPASFANYTDWYISANQGMGKCIAMANEQGAYVLTDKATFLTAQKNFSEFLANLDA